MIEAAVEAVLRGEVIGLPTDTVYGVGANPFDAEAIQSLYELKGRPHDKPVGLLVGSVEQAQLISDIQGRAEELAYQHWPGALTLVVQPKVVLPEWVGHRQRRSVGVRVPDHPTAIELLNLTGPLAVTSANLSGGPETMDDRLARDTLGDRVSVYVPGTSPGGTASTVVDCTTFEPQLIRVGPIEI